MGDNGRRAFETLHRRFIQSLDLSDDPDGCFKCRLSGGGGYSQLWLGVHDKRGPRIFAHRYSWEHFFGPIPKGEHVLHKCDNRKCVRPDHLFLGTKGDNNKDRAKKGRSAKGVTHGLTILSEEGVRRIRMHLAMGLRQVDIGEKYGVSQECISRIKRGATWGHVS